jgi:hypothetical protein
MTRIGIRLDDANALARLNQRFDDFYLIGFVYGVEGTTWYALPKEAPDEDITADSAELLLETLIMDNGARQEAKHKAGADGAERMST